MNDIKAPVKKSCNTPKITPKLATDTPQLQSPNIL
jgi:hypothetical protein